MSECWKIDNDYYALYTESRDIMRRVRRYYKDFDIMAEYIDLNGNCKAIQYKVPIKRKRCAKRLAKIT